MDTLLYTEPTKLKNPPSNWPRTAKFEGLIHRFRRSFYSMIILKRNVLKKILTVVSKHDCPDCHGQRLNDTVLSCKINGLNIAELQTYKSMRR